MTDIASWANNEILKIWQNYAKNPAYNIKEVPLLFPELKKHSLLFVGINPSSSMSGIKKIEKKSKRQPDEIIPHLIWKGSEKVDVQRIVNFETDSWKHYDYFAKFHLISNELGIPWSHIDLFFYRMKNQQEFKKIILNKSELNPFGRDQLNLAIEIVKKIKPRAMVIANAFACDLLRQIFSYFQNGLDPDLGCFHFQMNKGKGIPTFFTSMLTGQRALDKGSLERLIWQIKYVIKDN